MVVASLMGREEFSVLFEWDKKTGLRRRLPDGELPCETHLDGATKRDDRRPVFVGVRCRPETYPF